MKRNEEKPEYFVFLKIPALGLESKVGFRVERYEPSLYFMLGRDKLEFRFVKREVLGEKWHKDGSCTVTAYGADYEFREDEPVLLDGLEGEEMKDGN